MQRISHIKVEAILQDGYDLMALTELGGRPKEAWEIDVKYPNRVFCSEPSDLSDPAAGAAVVLSKRMSRHVMAFEAVGTRIVWVRLQGMHYNLLFIAAYIPQKSRAAPNQAQTLQQLESTCRTLRKRYPNDQILIGMDANCKIARNQGKLTGHGCIHYKNDAGGERLIELMSNIDLMAASTRFSSPKKSPLGQGTYIVDKERQLASQIDYILVDNKHKSNMLSCKVRWDRSMDNQGNKQDHGMVCMRMRFRIRAHKKKDSNQVNRDALKDDAIKAKFVKAYQDAAGPPSSPSSCRFERMQTAMKTASAVLPKPSPKPRVERGTSQATLDLVQQRRRKCQALGTTDRTGLRAVKADFHKLVARSARKDQREHIERLIAQVVEADERQDSREWWRAVHRISGKSRRFNNTMPEADSLEEVAEIFAEHAETLLAPSTREASRSRPPLPPASERAGDIPSPETVIKHLAALPNNKAAGPSGLPKELYSVGGRLEVDLVEVVQEVFEREVLPKDMPLADSIWIWKGKGSPSDTSQYRGLSLEEFAMKLVASILLERLTRETSDYLEVTQAGFRKKRSTRDNSFYLKSLIDLAVEMGEEMVIIFIDVKKAFDSVSHALIEEALRDAGASDKSIAMFRAIYSQARARCKVRGPDGTVMHSREYAIGRGVLQGSIASPLLFILALHFVFKSCDPSVITSGSMPPPAFQAKLGLWVHSLFYADDAALISASAEEASVRLTALKKGMEELSDMLIHWGKTKAMHAQQTIEVSKPKPAEYQEKEAKDLCTAKCEGCHESFVNEAGLRVHQRSCDLWNRMGEKDWPVERVIEARGTVEQRFYFVQWKGDWEPSKKRTWIPASWCNCKTAIAEFWARKGLCPDTDALPEAPNPMLDKTQGFVNRCARCNQFFKRDQDVKTHQTKSKRDGGCKRPPLNRSNTLAEAALKRLRRMKAQEKFDHVVVEGETIENVLGFTYVGTNLEADGSSEQDVKIRMALAKKQFGTFMDIWQSEAIGLDQKIALYKAGVLSVLVYGHTNWTLSRKVESSLFGWNSRCLALITGRDVPEECRDPTLDLVATLQARALRWAGQELRKPHSESVVHQMLVVLAEQVWEIGDSRSILTGCPPYGSAEELVANANDLHGWAAAVRKLDPSVRNDGKKIAGEWKALDAYAQVWIPHKPTHTLDVSATEWKKGAEVHDGMFKG